METIETTKTTEQVLDLLDLIELKDDIERLFDEEDYDSMLNECYGEVKIGGITFYPADILKDCDPTAYRCGYSDYCDAEFTNRGTEIVCKNGILYTLEEIDNDLF